MVPCSSRFPLFPSIAEPLRFNQEHDWPATDSISKLLLQIVVCMDLNYGRGEMIRSDLCIFESLFFKGKACPPATTLSLSCWPEYRHDMNQPGKCDWCDPQGWWSCKMERDRILSRPQSAKPPCHFQTSHLGTVVRKRSKLQLVKTMDILVYSRIWMLTQNHLIFVTDIVKHLHIGVYGAWRKMWKYTYQIMTLVTQGVGWDGIEILHFVSTERQNILTTVF